MGYFDLEIKIYLQTPLTLEVIKTILANCQTAHGLFYESSPDRKPGSISLEQAMQHIKEDLGSFRAHHSASFEVYFMSHPDQLGAEIAFRSGTIAYYPREKWIERKHSRFSIAYEWHLKQLLLITQPYKIAYLWAGDQEGGTAEFLSKKELTIMVLLDPRNYKEHRKSYDKRIALIETIISNGKEAGCVFQPYFLEPSVTVNDLSSTPLMLSLDSPVGPLKLAFGVTWLALTRDSKEKVDDLRPYIEIALALCKGSEILYFEAEKGTNRTAELLRLTAAALFFPIAYIIMYCYGLIHAIVFLFDNTISYFKKPRNKQ